MKNLNKGFVGVILMTCFLVAVTACGSREKGSKASDYTGYYTLRLKDYNIALQINKNGDVTYMHERDGSHRGTLEMDEDSALIYLNAAYSAKGETNSSYAKFCPLRLTLTGGGKQGFLSSDHSNWSPDSFEVVDKKTFEEFIDVESKNLVTWDGKTWNTLEQRNPKQAEAIAAEKAAEEERRRMETAELTLKGMISELWFTCQYYAEDEGGNPKDYADELLDEYFGSDGDFIRTHLDEIFSNGCDENGQYRGDLTKIIAEYAAASR